MMPEEQRSKPEALWPFVLRGGTTQPHRRPFRDRYLHLHLGTTRPEPLTLTTPGNKPSRPKTGPTWLAPSDGALRTDTKLSPVARRIREASIKQWGEESAVEIVGRSQSMVSLLERLEKMAPFDEPVLILGESGVGKEALSQSIYLLGERTAKPLVPVNCPQYQEGNLTVSELFGHKKGSFTGAASDRKGCFETADGGIVFLDEVADLHMSAQVMLLRALASGEFQPLGSDQTKRVDVRVIAATNRSLNQLAENREFRRDLIFRLRYFQIHVPPLRERDGDWLLLLDHFLLNMHQRYGVQKRFSDASLQLLETYPWPGNVRELITVTTMGYALAERDVIEPRDFLAQLEEERQPETPDEKLATSDEGLDSLYRSLTSSDGNFWELLQEPFLERDLNRRQVRRLVGRGLRETNGSYRDLCAVWNIQPQRYQKFMDFLRHHRLKPKSYQDTDL